MESAVFELEGTFSCVDRDVLPVGPVPHSIDPAE